jgi:beta-glucanase (GH16 family)
MRTRLRLAPLAAVIVAVIGIAALVAVAGPQAISASAPRTAPAGWRRVFTDNFTARVPLGRFPAAVRATWGRSYANGLKDTTGHGTYMPSQVVSYRRGVMNIHLHTARGRHMVAAVLPSIRGAHGRESGILYGRISIRMRADAVRGYKVTALLWPDSEAWPADGELDFPETTLTSVVFAHLHVMGATSGSQQLQIGTRTSMRGWHTYTLVWLPTVVLTQIDGHTVGALRSHIPSTPMHLSIQAETNTDGIPVPSNASGNVQLDWITIDTPSCNPKLSISPQTAAC